MNLVVFDFDGTLAATDGVDGECFIQAFDDALQIRDFSQEWTEYEHVTDEGITRQIFMERFGRHPHPDEREKVIDSFLALLKTRSVADSLQFSELPGASVLVNQLRNTGDWAVAVATGAWRRSVEFKIQRTGLPITEIPLASAEDGPSRESIVLTAVERAASYYGRQRFDRVVSVGDALWDVRTARKLGLPFIGIAEEPRATALRKDGAHHVIEDYRNTAQCLQFLNDARTPR